jgi:hypothetical protein
VHGSLLSDLHQLTYDKYATYMGTNQASEDHANPSQALAASAIPAAKSHCLVGNFGLKLVVADSAKHQLSGI